jgi:dienelactone hydrolase
MAERIVSMHAAYKSGKEVVDAFLSRPTAGDPRTAIVLIHGYRGQDDGQRGEAAAKSVIKISKWLRKHLA